MKNNESSLAPSKQTAAKTIHAGLQVLKEYPEGLRAKEVVEKLRDRLQLTEWELGTYEKTGYVRWESIFHFYTIGLVKAGYMRKNKRIWFITPEGEQALKLSPADLLDQVNSLYKQWAQAQPATPEGGGYEKQAPPLVNLEQLESQAIEGLRTYITHKNPYEFQDLVAALLRAMGYYTPFISPKGPDGGLDILAFQDPLGTKSPRIKVQVKHKPDSSVPVGEIKSLIGSMQKDGDVGLFVTSGKFTSEADKFARHSPTHIKLIDFDNFIDLWQQFYTKLSDEEKKMLPLHSIYFLDSGV